MSIRSKVLVTAVALAISGAAIAEEKKGPNVGEKAGEAAAELTAIDALRMSGALAAYGNARGDAAALYVAGTLAASADVKTVTREVSGKSAPADAEKDSGQDRSPEALAAAARSLAEKEGNTEVSGLIAAGETGASRGRVGGAVNGAVYRVDANATHVFNLRFEGGRVAQILAVGDGDTDLDMYVYDENGNEVCSDVLLDDYPACEWWPRWTGNFRVEIKNIGNVWNQYELYTN